MADVKVTFYDANFDEAAAGQEAYFSFQCPVHPGRRCEYLPIAGRVPDKRDPQGKNGGTAQWDWNGDRAAPTFGPSVDHGGCWHGYIVSGRTRDCAGNDEPERSKP